MAAVITSNRPAAYSPVVSAKRPNSTGPSCTDFSAERTYLRRPTIVGATARPAQAHYLQVPPTVVYRMLIAPAVAGNPPAVMNSKPGSEFHSAMVDALVPAATAIIPPMPAAVRCYLREVREAVGDCRRSTLRPHLRPVPRPYPHRWLSRRRRQQRPLPSNTYNSKHKPTYRRERSCDPTSTITTLHHSGISGTSGVYHLPTTITTCTR